MPNFCTNVFVVKFLKDKNCRKIILRIVKLPVVDPKIGVSLNVFRTSKLPL